MRRRSGGSSARCNCSDDISYGLLISRNPTSNAVGGTSAMRQFQKLIALLTHVAVRPISDILDASRQGRGKRTNSVASSQQKLALVTSDFAQNPVGRVVCVQRDISRENTVHFPVTSIKHVDPQRLVIYRAL